ncbi:MAG: phycobilisome rod-core linker polypeptide [Cyanobacteria bacterium J06633_8]
MSLSLLSYPLSSQNQRVNGYEIPGDEQPRIYTTNNLPKGSEIDEIIWACYRQIFNEQQIIKHHRQTVLESLLAYGQITVQQFIRGLLLSDSFRHLNYESNNNYRFVEMCIQRVLGRNVYNNQEKLSWSIVLATKGLKGFVDELLNSDEYIDNFGCDTVPYQRRRILPQQSMGELPFARMIRHDSYHKQRFVGLVSVDSAALYRRVLLLVPSFAVAALIATIILVAV